MVWAEVVLLIDHSMRCYRQGLTVEACRHVVRLEDVSLHSEVGGHVTHPLRLGGLQTEDVHHAFPRIEVEVLADDDHRAYWATEVARSGPLFLGHHTLGIPRYAQLLRGKEELDQSEGPESGQLDQDAVHC